MDLPMHPIPLAGYNPVDILGGQLGGGVGTQMARLQTFADGQHIHTGQGSTGILHGKGNLPGCPGENT